jgi:hypothetical protein
MSQSLPGVGRRRRPIVLAAIVLLVVGLTACQPVWPVKPQHLNDADAAAAWLVAEHSASGDTWSGGELADTIFALAATGADRDLADPVVEDLEAATPGYVQPGGVTDPGATAKVILAVQTVRLDPTHFAGLDLEALLRATMATDGTDAGRFGSSGAFTQALAVLSLARTPGKVPAEAGAWLAGIQCADGAFSWGACTWADADHTALAGTALLAAGGRKADAEEAAAWLLAHQNADGGFGDGASNANSTGLAAQLLRSTSHGAEADAAGAFVAGIQFTEGDDVGAIPWQAGIPGSLLLATTQGVLAWGAGPYHQLTFPQVQGEPCPDEDGVTVVVDLARFDGTIKVSCAPGEQATGWAALEAAGFEVGSVPGFEGQAICTIDAKPAEGYPTCWNDGFWAYFHDETRSGDWAFSDFGASNRTPPPGSVEGWRYEPDWASHWAVAPGIDPLWGTSCTTPDITAISPIDDDELLPVTGGWGTTPLVAAVDGSVPLTVELIEGATWTETTAFPLAGLSGPTRILARPSDPSCGSGHLAQVVLDVQPTYAPRSGTAGSPAVSATDTGIVAWATGHEDYVPGPNVATTWQVPANAYGAPGASGHVVVLGDDGRITLTFAAPITDGEGADLAVFENGFASGANDFLELGKVEVSSDGETYVGFDSASRRATAVGGFGTQSPAELGGLAGKDLQGWGTPFDLALLAGDPLVRSGAVDLSAITHVRIVDVVGDGSDLDSSGRPIYDPFPTTGSGGFDLNAVGVLNQA